MPTTDCDIDEEVTGCWSLCGLKFTLIYAYKRQ